MVEPTESEPLVEVDRFCNAMLAIRAEIAAVERGDVSAETSTAKYWPPVSRIDQAHGDKNLVCACPPPEAFED